MTGRIVLRLARLLLHADTLALVVMPAVADFEFEAATHSAGGRIRAYVATWVALIGAIWHDLIWDRRTPPWADAAATVATLTLLVASYHLAILILLLGFSRQLDMTRAARFISNVPRDWVLTILAFTFVIGTMFVATRARAAWRVDFDAPTDV